MNSKSLAKLLFCSVVLIFLFNHADGEIPIFRNQLGEVLEFDGWGEPGEDFLDQQFIANFKTDYLVLPYGETEAKLDECTVDPDLLEILLNHKVYYVEQVFKGLDSGDTTMTVDEKVIRTPDISQIYVLHQDGGVVIDAITELYDFEGIVYAEPSYFAYADAPDDIYWEDQWNLFMPDEVHGEYGIGAERAWESTTGGGVIKIGFIDTGMDYTSYDFGECLGPPWECDKVIGGRDYFSWPIPDPDPMDGRGHGTSCAHIAAAYTNNIYYIAGIAGGWGDWSTREDVGALLVALKIASDDPGGGWCLTPLRAQAIYEAAHPDYFNCDILSCSWGYETHGSMPITERLAILIGYLAGASFVASSGNDPNGFPHYPSSFDETWVTSVGSYGSTGCRCDNDNDCDYVSGWLWNVDLLAPGYQIPTVNLSGYMPNFGGTSAACPHVSGSIALVRSLIDGLQNEDTEWILKYSAWDPDSNACEGTGADGNNRTHDTYYGHGELRLSRAIERIHFPGGQTFWRLSKHSVSGQSSNYLYLEDWYSFIGGNPLQGSYEVDVYDIRRTVVFSETFSEVPYIWGLGGPETIGWSAADPNMQEGFCRLVPGTETLTGCELQTFVYWIESLNEWYPCQPEDVEFQYRLWGKIKEDTPNGPVPPKLECEIPSEFILRGNSPNPFNSSTNINFVIPNDDFVRLTIYDLLGNEVLILLNQDLPAGSHSINWNGKNKKSEDVSSGIYYYRMETNENAVTKKMVLMR